ncbi:MAG: glycine--tRNA ligase subunit beta [Gammaproteobacteria bacterium]
MSAKRDLLVEIGTEELPPRALEQLSATLGQSIATGFDMAQIGYGDVANFATPRRLAVLIQDLSETQPDRQVLKRGPALSAAFDAEHRPMPAALGFAKSCGVAVEALEQLATDQGNWLAYRSTLRGQQVRLLIPGIVRAALAQLPIPKRMRWGAGSEEFVRPVHWAVLLFGPETLAAELLGVKAGHATRGHRFHHPDPILLYEPSAYPLILETSGRVLADFARRRDTIRGLVEGAAQAIGATPVIDPDLLAEVTALTEWPVTVVGDFDKQYLELPAELLIATLKGQQKYFHLIDDQGRILPHFVAISNIESLHPETVRRGNERVVNPRLADAAFFWRQDRRTLLYARRELLKGVVYQEKLGTVFDKSQRLAALAAHIAARIGGDPALAERAGRLAKCDLLTDLVGEFPELQGVMGRYYAAHDGEPEEVAVALLEQYLPRHAGDRLPQTKTGQALALADKLDTLAGVFGIGQAPSGDRDPFGLRRAALGSLRIMMECELALDAEELLTHAVLNYAGRIDAETVVARVFDFMMERLRGYLIDDSISPEVFEAVLARCPTCPYDLGRRVRAVSSFQQLPEAAALAAANKRINNLLKQAQGAMQGSVDEHLLSHPAEIELAKAVQAITPAVESKFRNHDYAGALKTLADLRAPIDTFFDQVLVLCEDTGLRTNRLALLQQIKVLFLEVADISRLPG